MTTAIPIAHALIGMMASNGAFSFNSSENQAPRKRNEDSDEEDEEATDCMAKNVLDFILLHDKEEDTQGDNVPIKKRRQP